MAMLSALLGGRPGWLHGSPGGKGDGWGRETSRRVDGKTAGSTSPPSPSTPPALPWGWGLGERDEQQQRRQRRVCAVGGAPARSVTAARGLPVATTVSFDPAGPPVVHSCPTLLPPRRGGRA